MADLKAVFVIMLMINIGAGLVFPLLSDTKEAGKIANSSLNVFFVAGEGGRPVQTQTINETTGMALPITEEVVGDQTILSSTNPLRMISKWAVLFLSPFIGLLLLLIGLSAPIQIIMLVGVPFTLIYVLSGLLFFRGVN